MSERMIKEHSKVYGIKYSIFWLFNVYGKNSKRGIIKVLLNVAYRGNLVKIFSGKQKSDLVYVDDAIKIRLYNERLERIFNVGIGRAYSINTLINFIEGLTNKNIKTIKENSIKGDILYTCVDNSKLLSKVNFKFTSLKKGLKLII